MKKMKFTLGLMLSMLILGANVAYSQQILGHNASFSQSMTVWGCNFYSSVTFQKVVYSPADAISANYSSSGTLVSFPLTGTTSITEEGVSRTETLQTWTYGTTAGTITGSSNPTLNTGGDYNFNPTSNMISPTTAPSGTTTANLGYLNHKGGVSKAYNRIVVQLAYVNGNELTPVLKRTIVIGRWAVNSNNLLNFPSGSAGTTGIEVVEYLRADTIHFRPVMDRATGYATYIFEDQMLPLINKYPVYSISYELSINDEIDSPGINYYQPPTKVDPTQLRAFQVETEKGIVACDKDGNKLWWDLLYYVETNKDLTLQVFSETPLEVKVAPKNPDLLRQPGGVVVTDNKDGSYAVTIKRIQYNVDISFSATEPKSTVIVYSEDGDPDHTGNEVVSADKVWSASGTLFVEAAKPGTLSVYSVTGQLYNQVAVSGNYTLALPKGLFIVQLNGKAYKVVN